METGRTALVLGATGGIGGAVAAALRHHGWQVRAMARTPAKAVQGIRWVEGDAMRGGDVLRAAEGAEVIVHAVNPAGYRDWDKLLLPMIGNTIAAARSCGARVVLPGNTYNFDPAAVPLLGADSPQQPRSRKGLVRRELEAQLEAAAPGVPSLILRAGDVFGPGARSSWFSQAMVQPGRPLRRVTEISRGPGHSWAYLPDLGEAFARLLDIPGKLEPFERVQFEGLVDATGRDMSEAAERACGRPLRRVRFSWGLMRVLAPFGGLPREAADIADHWRHPVRLDNRRLETLIGTEPRTSLDAAIRATLAEMGCL
ncbi:NAD(P)H-binding protein [Mangrovicoccus sp. HB161399]|uniref:NAD(P)H-binding protein n=1 Tax=Mangrovicoccus sp. HB161399 TaxID=2720392 RepID=UPI001553E711|nr:NAD(P)H-binding protein [Mangrovicoccus sp. HB161399]